MKEKNEVFHYLNLIKLYRDCDIVQGEDVRVEDIQKGISDFSFRVLNALFFWFLTALGKLILFFVWISYPLDLLKIQSVIDTTVIQAGLLGFAFY